MSDPLDPLLGPLQTSNTINLGDLPLFLDPPMRPISPTSTVYSCASSRTESTNYGIYVRRMALSDMETVSEGTLDHGHGHHQPRHTLAVDQPMIIQATATRSGLATIPSASQKSGVGVPEGSNTATGGGSEMHALAKKVMQWLRKKSIERESLGGRVSRGASGGTTMRRTHAQPPSPSHDPSLYHTSTHPYAQLRIHIGAVEPAAITTRPPPEVMAHVRKVLAGMGVEAQIESEYKVRCRRRRRNVTFDVGGKRAQGGGGQGTGSQLGVVKTSAAGEPAYGDPSKDAGDEVCFLVELTRIDRLDHTYSLDIRRLKGSLRSYKFLYDTFRDLTKSFR